MCNQLQKITCWVHGIPEIIASGRSTCDHGLFPGHKLPETGARHLTNMIRTRSSVVLAVRRAKLSGGIAASSDVSNQHDQNTLKRCPCGKKSEFVWGDCCMVRGVWGQDESGGERQGGNGVCTGACCG